MCKYLLATFTGSMVFVLGEAMKDMDIVMYVIAGLIAFDRVLALFRARRVNMEELQSKVSDLHQWHNVDRPEEPGVRIWWRSREELETLREVAKTVREAAIVLRDVKKELRRYEDD